MIFLVVISMIYSLPFTPPHQQIFIENEFLADFFLLTVWLTCGAWLIGNIIVFILERCWGSRVTRWSRRSLREGTVFSNLLLFGTKNIDYS